MLAAANRKDSAFTFEKDVEKATVARAGETTVVCSPRMFEDSEEEVTPQHSPRSSSLVCFGPATRLRYEVPPAVPRRDTVHKGIVRNIFLHLVEASERTRQLGFQELRGCCPTDPGVEDLLNPPNTWNKGNVGHEVQLHMSSSRLWERRWKAHTAQETGA